jgi:hypothetical protein
VGPLYLNISVSFISWVIHGKSAWKFYARILSFTQNQPLWAFNPSSLGSIHPRIPRDKEIEGNNDVK